MHDDTAHQQPTLPDKLRQFRREEGLSIQQLAEKIGTPAYTVRRWEVGASLPSREAADKLTEIGFIVVPDHWTNGASRSRIKRGSQSVTLDQRDYSFDVAGAGFATPPSWAINGPPDQDDFYRKLLTLQVQSGTEFPRERLSVVNAYAPGQRTSQSLLENPKPTAASWNSNYGSHGWHRYVGRFPPHVVRALLNHFGADETTVVCDPFSGSGTTAVECRLLGIPFVGIEIGALSHLMGKVKATFPTNADALASCVVEYASFMRRAVDDFENEHPNGYTVGNVLADPRNVVPSFSNIEKWFTSEAFLGVSLTVHFARSKQGFERDALLLALSAKMRSIGNVDVDVVRAEYTKEPRRNVNVTKLVTQQLKKMASNIEEMNRTHAQTISDGLNIRLIEGSALSVKLEPGSIDYIVTSPPYGVEALSYLRTHLLSYRSLASELDHDPYQTRDQTVGSEYLEEAVLPATLEVMKASSTFREFFLAESQQAPDKKTRQRRAAMMKFFEDMHVMGQRMAEWLKDGGRVAWVIGNKRLGERVIPTDEIIRQSFENSGLQLYDVIRHKLKTNNSNSQVPWQERIIQEEAIMLFERVPR